MSVSAALTKRPPTIRKPFASRRILPLPFTIAATLIAPQNQHARALEDFSEAIRIDPKFAHAYTQRGVIHSLAGRHDQAIADYDQALRLDPNHAPTYYNRATAHRAKGETSDAIADYRKVLSLDPSVAKAKEKLQELGVSQP